MNKTLNLGSHPLVGAVLFEPRKRAVLKPIWVTPSPDVGDPGQVQVLVLSRSGSGDAPFPLVLPEALFLADAAQFFGFPLDSSPLSDLMQQPDGHDAAPILSFPPQQLYASSSSILIVPGFDETLAWPDPTSSPVQEVPALCVIPVSVLVAERARLLSALSALGSPVVVKSSQIALPAIFDSVLARLREKFEFGDPDQFSNVYLWSDMSMFSDQQLAKLFAAHVSAIIRTSAICHEAE